MATLFLRRTPTGFEPASVHSAQDMQRIKVGKEVRCEVKEERNVAFHNKAMSLIRTGYKCWSTNCQGVEIDGVMVTPCFETYREQMTIMAGYFHYVLNIDGSVIPKADSISFAKMDQERFERFYNDIGQKILESLNGMFSSVDEMMIHEEEIANYF